MNETYSNARCRNPRRTTFTLSTPAPVRGGPVNHTFVGVAGTDQGLFLDGRSSIFSGAYRQSTANSTKMTTRPMYDSKKTDLSSLQFTSLDGMMQLKEENLKKIKHNRGSLGRSDVSGMSDDLFDTSCLDSTSPKKKTLEKLRATENQLNDELENWKTKISNLKSDVTATLKENKGKTESLKNLNTNKLAEIDQLNENLVATRKEKNAMFQKGVKDRAYVGVMSAYTESLFKVDENFRCTDLSLCKSCHQDPGKCLRIKSLSATINHPN
ncbi:hypothetical protein Ocin01_06628 [Orchesella cincta]|uniref:Uncharacterized protein n=1 Tax=Orchesella cincta TaxID=48709 RepID=A0A1D2N457_ORCCI|nr:hypothetical protein Ocin01_06628 [Orchesella cincta]